MKVANATLQVNLQVHQKPDGFTNNTKFGVDFTRDGFHVQGFHLDGAVKVSKQPRTAARLDSKSSLLVFEEH
jgi:hypothetical protein